MHNDVSMTHLQPVFALASTHQLSNTRDQHVHGGYSLAIIVQAHVERFDLGRVVVHDDGLVENLLCQIPLMLAPQIIPPFNLQHPMQAISETVTSRLQSCCVFPSVRIASLTEHEYEMCSGAHWHIMYGRMHGNAGCKVPLGTYARGI